MMACETDQVVPEIPMKVGNEFEQEDNEKITQTEEQCDPVYDSTIVCRRAQSPPASSTSNSKRQLMIKLTSDARPISPAEMCAIRHLFTPRR